MTSHSERTQAERVFAFMLDGKWHSLKEIAVAAAGNEAGIGARLRDLRKIEYGGHKVDRARIGEVWHYRLTQGDSEPPPTVRRVKRPPPDAKAIERLLNHSGAIGLLCELSTQLRHSAEKDEHLDLIERCIDDYCKITGGSYQRTLDRIEVFP
jgi:hypothetical protein